MAVCNPFRSISYVRAIQVLSFEQCGDRFRSRSGASSSISRLEGDSFEFTRIDDKIRSHLFVADNKDRLGTLGARGVVSVVNLLIQQKYFDIFGAIGK